MEMVALPSQFSEISFRVEASRPPRNTILSMLPISKLEAWFQEKHLSEYQEHIKFLRNLQELRSSGTGHRKGKSYQKISKVFDVQRENYAETFSNILENVISFLNYIETHFEELSK